MRKNSLSKAFAGVKRGTDRPTETTGFYKPRREGVAGGPSAGLSSGQPFTFHLKHEEAPGQAISGASSADYYLEDSGLIAKTPLKVSFPLVSPGLENNRDGLSGGLEGGRVPLQKVPEIPTSYCGRWAMCGECGKGHKYAKALDCGREWCPECKESAHKRRLARWLPKAQKIKNMGYLVVTFPPDKRPRTKKALSRIGILITEGLKRRGFNRGLRRWHFFGDKTHVWHPHLNFLFESEYISEERLKSIKKMICEVLKVEKLVINFQYTQSLREIFHWLKYITRPTFLKRYWDKEMAEEIYDFRNCASWGKWDGEDKWTIPESEKELSYLAKIEHGICPQCGLKLHWSRIVKTEDLIGQGYEQIWKKLYQAKAPPDKVLEYDFFKKLLRAQKRGVI